MGYRKIDHLNLLCYLSKIWKESETMAIFFVIQKAYDATWRYVIPKPLHQLYLRLPTFIHKNFLPDQSSIKMLFPMMKEKKGDFVCDTFFPVLFCKLHWHSGWTLSPQMWCEMHFFHIIKWSLFGSNNEK